MALIIDNLDILVNLLTDVLVSSNISLNKYMYVGRGTFNVSFIVEYWYNTEPSETYFLPLTSI